MQKQTTGVGATTAAHPSNEDTGAEKATLASASVSKAKPSKDQIIYDDVELSYVKEDIAKTLVLIGIILAVYTGVWLLMSYTSVGTQILRVFSG